MNQENKINQRINMIIKKLSGKKIQTCTLSGNQENWIFENVILLKRQTHLTFCTYDIVNRITLINISVSKIEFFDFIEINHHEFLIVFNDGNLIKKWTLRLYF